MTWEWRAVLKALFPWQLGQVLSSSWEGESWNRRFRAEQTQAPSLHKGRCQAEMDTVLQHSSAGWHEGLPISEVWWLKKCGVKRRQQATKQPGGRMESVNKSTSPYTLCFRNSTLTQPYLFHKGSTKRDSTSLSFSPLTQRILGTLITS